MTSDLIKRAIFFNFTFFCYTIHNSKLFIKYDYELNKSDFYDVIESYNEFDTFGININ
jgi:hypothetical protein